ncbi:hypothetical protein PybrP1_006552 [[Pythium] brassicae (nom. inval.)]|nr:hypothetical protein PybrP1_006552 [[Pythium] brassicae (nom. inval.)]
MAAALMMAGGSSSDAAVEPTERLARKRRAPTEVPADAAEMSKKQRVEAVAAVAKDVMISLLTSTLSYDVPDADYERLVTLSQAHPKFEKLFGFPFDEAAGWVRPRAKKRSTTLRVVALDCEMCVTAPVGNSAERVSNALCRVSAVDGDDMIRSIISDFIVHQPEAGYRMVDPKTDIHGITLEMIDQSKITLAKAQKQLLKYISSDTIVVGHSVHGDLASLRIDHRRVIDTALIFQRKDGDPKRSTPGLKCLTKFLLNFEMPNGHDSAIDAQASMLAAKYATRHPVGNIIPSSLELHGPRDPADSARSRPPSQGDIRAARSCRLRMHRIPRGVTESDIERFFVASSKVVATAVEKITYKPNQNRGACQVTFASGEHASLAFKTVALTGDGETKATLDSIGREQVTIAVTTTKGKVFKNIALGVL